MKSHLSDSEMAALLMGTAGKRALHHINTCATCHEQLSRFEAALRGLGSSVRAWSAEEAAKICVAPPTRNLLPRWCVHFAGATFAVALLSLVLMKSNAPGPEPAMSDSALLSQVQGQISRSAPAAMEPLAALMSARNLDVLESEASATPNDGRIAR